MWQRMLQRSMSRRNPRVVPQAAILYNRAICRDHSCYSEVILTPGQMINVVKPTGADSGATTILGSEFSEFSADMTMLVQRVPKRTSVLLYMMRCLG